MLIRIKNRVLALHAHKRMFNVTRIIATKTYTVSGLKLTHVYESSTPIIIK